MNPPESVLEKVRRTLEEATGKAPALRRTTPVGGGCINPSVRLESQEGESWFLKWNDSAPVEMFRAEADGLEALLRGAAGTEITIPEVLGWGGGETREDPGWLLMEFIPQGSPGPSYGSRLGEALGRLHASPREDPGSGQLGPATSGAGRAPPGFGWHRDNFIGSLPQENGAEEDWATFWRERRLEPQLRMATDAGYFRGGEGRVMDQLLGAMDSILAEGAPQGPSLLHGDLWSGNYYPGPQGNPVLIDPAVYLGHGEVDLAMMELFGSLPQGFREGYGGQGGIPAAYDAFRRDLYQLYYLLVHVNLFGGGYVSGSVAAARRVLAGA